MLCLGGSALSWMFDKEDTLNQAVDSRKLLMNLPQSEAAS